MQMTGRQEKKWRIGNRWRHNDGWMVTHADGDAEVVSVSRQSSSDAECGKGGSEGEQGAEITRNLAYFLHRQSLAQILFYH